MQGSYVAYDMTNYKVDPTNFNSPLERIFADEYNIINTKLSLEYVIGFKPLILSSNDGLVLNTNTQHLGLDYDEKIFNKLIELETSFISFTFEGTST